MSTYTQTGDEQTSTDLQTATEKIERAFEDEENVRVTTYAVSGRITVTVDAPDDGCTIVPSFYAPDDYEMHDAAIHARGVMTATFKPKEDG